MSPPRPDQLIPDLCSHPDLNKPCATAGADTGTAPIPWIVRTVAAKGMNGTVCRVYAERCPRCERRCTRVVTWRPEGPHTWVTPWVAMVLDETMVAGGELS